MLCLNLNLVDALLHQNNLGIVLSLNVKLNVLELNENIWNFARIVLYILLKSKQIVSKYTLKCLWNEKLVSNFMC